MAKRLNLTGNGFKRRPDLDFSDDGTRFVGYEYSNMPITYAKYEDEYFISVRSDYVIYDSSIAFTSEDWRITEEYALEDEFNGVTIDKVDIEKLKENCIRIYNKINELNEVAKNEVIDYKPIVKELEAEIKSTKKFIEKFKKNFQWYKFSKYELSDAKNYITHFDEEVIECEEIIKEITNNSYNKKELRLMSQFLKEFGYVKIKKEGFYIKQLTKLLEEQERM